MYSPLINIAMQYVGPVIAGILVGIICRAYFASRIQKKIKGYQGEIVKSHAKILELEAKNDQIEKRLKEVEGNFNKDRIFMN